MQEFFMRQALALAEEAAAAGEVPVGCVVVREGVVIGRGRNRREEKQSALSHAETARIKRVWYGARDRAFGACGGVCNLFMENFPNPPALVGGILEAECQAVLSGFFERLREKR